MNIKWYRDSGTMAFDGHVIQVTCIIRNEINGRRSVTEPPVYTEPDDGSSPVPYMPRLFPRGSWKIVAVLPKTDPYMAPEFISTNAWQLVDELTEVDGHYGPKTGGKVRDSGYGFHNSMSATTLGCGKIVRNDDRELLVSCIKAAWENHEDCMVEVI